MSTGTLIRCLVFSALATAALLIFAITVSPA
jgi:hypothetical protein